MHLRLKIFCLVFLLLSYGGLSFGQETNNTYKTYPGAKMVKLPQPNYKGIPVEEAIKKRRSVRSYSKKALTLPQLSQLLFAAQGITGSVSGFGLRAAPSAGALYPIEVYVVVNNIEALSQGIYHYNVQKHAVELLKEGDFRKEITNAGLWQDMLGDANVTFVLSAVFERTQRKYGDRSLRYIYMEAGHISQNIALQAVSLGLGSVSIGAFYDEQVNKLIGLDGSRESVIYLQAVGTL
jgi:SagB-type dehydrogenase family enzyme